MRYHFDCWVGEKRERNTIVKGIITIKLIKIIIIIIIIIIRVHTLQNQSFKPFSLMNQFLIFSFYFGINFFCSFSTFGLLSLASSSSISPPSYTLIIISLRSKALIHVIKLLALCLLFLFFLNDHQHFFTFF